MSNEMQSAAGENSGSVHTPYGTVVGPIGAVRYLAELIADDTGQAVSAETYAGGALTDQTEWSEAKQAIWHLIWDRYGETSAEAARLTNLIWGIVEKWGNTTAPPGMQLVPIEPTEAMLVNGREALMPLVRLTNWGPLVAIWKDMLANAFSSKGGLVAETRTDPSPALQADYDRYIEIKKRQQAASPNHDWAEVFKHNLGTSNLHEVVADFIAQNQGPSPVPALMEVLTTAAVRFSEIVDAAAPSNIDYHNQATINGIHANAAVAEAEMADALTALHMGLKTDG